MNRTPHRTSPRTTSRSSVPATVYWFRAKPSGLGWDWPLCWQGWLSYGLALACLVVGAVVFPPTASPAAFVISNAVVVVLLLGVCAWKGEPLRRTH